VLPHSGQSAVRDYGSRSQLHLHSAGERVLTAGKSADCLSGPRIGTRKTCFLPLNVVDSPPHLHEISCGTRQRALPAIRDSAQMTPEEIADLLRRSVEIESGDCRTLASVLTSGTELR
jgi:hypothetical protein